MVGIMVNAAVGKIVGMIVNGVVGCERMHEDAHMLHIGDICSG